MMPLLASELLPASYRGAPFAVLADETGGGRRVALHQYPGRDQPWAEDMGRAARTFRFRGFIVTGDVVFAGGPIQLQRLLLLAALEASGPGLLTHPTLGALQVSVTRFAMGADLGAGRMSTLDLEFVEAGAQTYPSLLSSGSGLLSAANLLKVGLAVDAVRALAVAGSASGSSANLAATNAACADQVVAQATDATALHRLAAQLPGNLGRFAGGGNAGVSGTNASIYAGSTDIGTLIAAASTARVAVGTAAVALASVIATTTLSDPSAVPAAVVALVAALAAACADPADAIRLLVGLAQMTPARPEAATSIGQAYLMLFRRAVVAQLAGAAGAYQPTSSDDAATMIALLAGVIDTVATAAADAGEDQSFDGLRAIRAAIVQDLRRRGSTLAQIRTFSLGAPLPAPVLAQRFYRDPSRADQLVIQAAPVHPLFMPVSFGALAA